MFPGEAKPLTEVEGGLELAKDVGVEEANEASLMACVDGGEASREGGGVAMEGALEENSFLATKGALLGGRGEGKVVGKKVGSGIDLGEGVECGGSPRGSCGGWRQGMRRRDIGIGEDGPRGAVVSTGVGDGEVGEAG